MMIGLTSANFGALVRYKIPLIPFYFTYLSILYGILKNENTETATLVTDNLHEDLKSKLEEEKTPEFKLPKKYKNMYR
jgi:hypothetical protein